MAPTSKVVASLMRKAPHAYDGEAGLVNRVADTLEQLPDLILGQRVRQPFRCGEAILFSPNSPHIASRVW